jgi:hypothetical protein
MSHQPSVSKFPHKHIALVSALCAMAISASADAQTPGLKSTTIAISVVERSDLSMNKRPFPNVGLFKMILGDTPYEKAQCPSRSNNRGTTACRIACDPTDETEWTLVLRPPGSESVPDYEVPIARELTLSGCTLSDKAVTFEYTQLELALMETLNSDPELRQAVAMPAATPTFAALKPFDESQAALRALIERNPNNPAAARFSRILHDAAAANVRTIDRSTATKVRAISVGTQSIYVNSAARRSLGTEKGARVAPVTTDGARLKESMRDYKNFLDTKSDRTRAEVQLQKQFVRDERLGGPKNLSAPPKIEWSKVNGRDAGR